MARGNPNIKAGPGRPKGSKNKVSQEKRMTLAELARAHTGTALNALVDVAKNGTDSAKVAAASALLDRAYGRPVQSIEGAGENGEHLLQVGVNDDLRSALDSIANKLASSDSKA